MQFTKQQIIFSTVAGVLGLLLLAVLFGALPGRRENVEVTELTMWGVDDQRLWKNIISSFRATYPEISVSYKRFDAESYERELINALAAGEGPDIAMFDNNWLLTHEGKVAPAPAEKIAPATVQGLFPRVVEQDFVAAGGVYALPLFIDTLALVYNRDLFDQGNIVFPPKTWDEAADATPALRIIEGGVLQRGAFAIGGASVNTPNASGIASAILMQGGSSMIDSRVRDATFADSTGRKNFGIYMRFADPASNAYSWDEYMREGKDAFARGEVAGIFVYASERKDLEARNSFLDMATAPLPQLNPEEPVNVADYWGLTVLTRTPHPNEAWDFVIFATTDQNSATSYMNSTQRPPALRSLINDTANNPEIGVFVSQALTARSWLQPGEEVVESAFDEAIRLVLSGELSADKALQRAESLITEAIGQR
ncbi:MAG: extracellular solute-binding protein [Patescibacteria group bacterium]|nr:extracellular solute-binding protein [Patescibacteria group bacterium]